MSSSDDVGETWTTPEANSILHLILVELRASENFRPPVPLPVKSVSVLVLPNTLSCSSVSFRYHWMSVTVSLHGEAMQQSLQVRQWTQGDSPVLYNKFAT